MVEALISGPDSRFINLMLHETDAGYACVTVLDAWTGPGVPWSVVPDLQRGALSGLSKTCAWISHHGRTKKAEDFGTWTIIIF